MWLGTNFTQETNAVVIRRSFPRPKWFTYQDSFSVFFSNAKTQLKYEECTIIRFSFVITSTHYFWTQLLYFFTFPLRFPFSFLSFFLFFFFWKKENSKKNKTFFCIFHFFVSFFCFVFFYRRFSDFFKEYKKVTAGNNGLISLLIKIKVSHYFRKYERGCLNAYTVNFAVSNKRLYVFT